MPKARWIIRRALPALLLLLFALALWLTVSPRHIPLLEANLETALSSALAPHRVSAEEARLGIHWTPLPHLTLHVRNMALLDAEGKPATRLPAVDVELSLARLALGTLRLTRLEMKGALVAVHASEDGRLSLGFSDVPANEEDQTNQISRVNFDLSRLPVQEVRVRNARMIISSPRGFSTFDLPQFYVHNTANILRAELELRSNEGKIASVKIKGKRNQDGGTHLRAHITQLPSASIVHLVPHLAILQGLNLEVTGQAALEFSANRSLEKFNVLLKAKQGTYLNPTFFAEPLTIDAFNIKMSGNGELVNIHTSMLQTPDVVIKLAGTLQGKSSQLTGDLIADVEGLSSNDLYKYWPITMAPQTREWVTTHIRNGHIPQAQARLRFTPEDLAAPFLPDAAVAASLQLENADIHYMDRLPPAKEVKADILITGETLRANIHHAALLSGTTVKNSSVEINNFNDLTTPVNLKLYLSTPAKDVATMLSPANLHLASALKLDPASIEGNITGKLVLGLIIYPEEAGPVQDISSIVNYRIEADVTNASQKNLMGRWDLQDLNGHFKADNQQLSLESTTSLQAVPGTLRITQKHAPYATTYRWQADMPVGKLASLGLPIPQGITGVTGVDATLREREGAIEVSGHFDVTQTDLLLTDMGYRKPAGKAGTLQISYTDSNNTLQNIAFIYQSDAEKLQGAAQLGTEQSLLSVDLPIIKIAGNDLSAHYRVDADGMRRLQLSGLLLNAAPWMEASESSNHSEADSSDPLLNFALDVSVGKVLLGPNRALRTWQGQMSCRGEQCQSASLAAQTESDKSLNYNITQNEKQRELHIHAEDAGEILRVMKIAEHVRDGTLDVRGTFNTEKAGQPLEASVLMENFSLEDAPALTKLLSVLSLTGLRDTVSGQGIRFRKLTGTISYENDDLIIHEAKTYGPAIGVTLEGEIANQGRELALTGTLVPSYTANSLLGNIPVLGKAFVGGEGEGVFAARFSVKGPVSDPEVGVNPLSLLTPGFLRNLFEIAESKSANRVVEQKKPEAALPVPVDATESAE